VIELTGAGGGSAAVVSPVGAALRRLDVAGRSLIEPTVHSERAPGLAGALLAPWPNRVEGGRWWLGSREQRFTETEPGTGHALHGLLADREFAIAARTDGSVELTAAIDPEPGYPFALRVAVTYRLTDRGVDAEITIRNRDAASAPVAVGIHPYLRLGARDAQELSIDLDAEWAYHLDATEIPRHRFAVEGTAWDLRGGRPVTEVPRHATFEHGAASNLDRVLRAPDGDRVTVWADEAFRWTQLYVMDDFAADDGRRTAVAVEPMTAPPNALRTGIGLRWLDADEEWTLCWGIRFEHAAASAAVAGAPVESPAAARST
jgi:aldose 1-epimerase